MPKLKGAAQKAWSARSDRVDAMLAELYKKGWNDDTIAVAIRASSHAVARWRKKQAVPQPRQADALAALHTGVKAGKIQRPAALVA